MTAIVGVVEDGKVWLGGDAAGVGGLSMQTRSDPKVFKNGESVIGYTTSFRMGQILEHHLSLPTPYENESGMGYMVKRFIPAVKSVLKQHGFETSESGREHGGNFLIGYRGHLYDIESDYQVARVAQPYHSVGCGFELALGSLYSTQCLKMSPKKRITTALNAATEFCVGVRPPFTIVST